MNIEEELRQLLRETDEVAAPNLRPRVLSAIAPRGPAGLPAWPGRAAVFGVVMVVVLGVAVVSLSKSAGRPVDLPSGENPRSIVALPTRDLPPESTAPPPTAGVASPSATHTGTLALATNPAGGGGGDALAAGRVGGMVVDDRACFWIEPLDSGAVEADWTALVWPNGFGAVDDPLRLLTPDGQEVARVGDLVELGGGGPPIDYMPTSEQDPCGIGQIFSVSVVVRVNGKEINAGAGSLRITTRQPGDPGTCGPTFLDPVMLVMSDSRLQLRMSGVDRDATWPHGFKAMAGDRITIVDQDGVVVLRQGVEMPTVRGSIVNDQVVVCGFGEVAYD